MVEEMTREEFCNRATKLFQSYFDSLGIRQEANREAGEMFNLESCKFGSMHSKQRFGGFDVSRE